MLLKYYRGLINKLTLQKFQLMLKLVVVRLVQLIILAIKLNFTIILKLIDKNITTKLQKEV